MKILKKIFILLIMIILNIINVKAANDIFNIEEVYIDNKNETINVSNPSYEDNNIESTIEFNKVGDYVEYKIVLINNAEKIYKIKGLEYNNSNEYVDVTYHYKNDEIKGNDRFEIYVTLKYIDEVYSDNLVYNLDDISLKIRVEEIEANNEQIIAINPNTNDDIKQYVIIIFVSIIFLPILIKTKKKVFIIPLLMILGITSYVKADSDVEIIINLKNNVIKIDTNKFSQITNEEIGITKENIGNIYFVRKEDLPNSTDGSFNISKYDEEKVREYFVKNDDIYDIYIVSKDLYSKYESKDISYLLSEYPKLKEIDLSYLDLSNITDMNHMFYGDTNLEKIIWPENLNTSKVTDMSYLFRDCNSLKGVDVSKFDTSKVTSMKSMFYKCNSLTHLDVSNFDTSNVEEMNFMFLGCTSLNELDVSNFDTGKVTTMKSMFNKCSNLTNLDVSNFDTSKVTDMGWMFYNCNSLKELDVSNFDTTQVTNLQYMFNGDTSLEKVDLSSFDTSNVENMSYMFSSCSALKNLNLSNFNTSSVTDMNWMFGNCSSLEQLDISNFNTELVTSMYAMFYNCNSLEHLDISSFNFNSIETVEFMFMSMKKLKTIFVNENILINDGVKSTNMFMNDIYLKGENGTSYNKSNVNSKYAKIDTEDNPGYFTRK